MGCTLTAALVRENLALVANAGDSRTYLLHEARLRKITRDHSVVASLIEQGMIGEDEVHAHVQKGIIYRSLGGELDATYDLFTLEVDPSDRLLLCSDGLWEMVPDSLIEDVLLERYEARDACNRLVELANLAGGEDNISVIVVNIGELPNT